MLTSFWQIPLGGICWIQVPPMTKAGHWDQVFNHMQCDNYDSKLLTMIQESLPEDEHEMVRNIIWRLFLLYCIIKLQNLVDWWHKLWSLLSHCFRPKFSERVLNPNTHSLIPFYEENVEGMSVAVVRYCHKFYCLLQREAFETFKEDQQKRKTRSRFFHNSH